VHPSSPGHLSDISRRRIAASANFIKPKYSTLGNKSFALGYRDLPTDCASFLENALYVCTFLRLICYFTKTAGAKLIQSSLYAE
jgi:hypothetical protein